MKTQKHITRPQGAKEENKSHVNRRKYKDQIRMIHQTGQGPGPTTRDTAKEENHLGTEKPSSMYNAICVVYSFRIQKESNLFFATIEYSFININIFSVSRCSFIFWFGSARYQKETYHIVVLIFPYCTSYYNPILWTLIGHYYESHLQNGHKKSFIVPIIIYIL